jgi:hypothetical protein
MCQDEVVKPLIDRSRPWNMVSTIGLDLAKNVFQVHGIDAQGKVLLRRALRRSEVLPYFTKLSPCLVGMEACATAHHWARELIKLGHTVKLMPPAYVKPYVKRGKNDAADAEAIAEAVSRPTMRFVAVQRPDHRLIVASRAPAPIRTVTPAKSSSISAVGASRCTARSRDRRAAGSRTSSSTSAGTNVSGRATGSK